MPEDLVNVRYMVDDVEAALDFYTTHLGFALGTERARRRSPRSSAAACGCCSAGRPAPPAGRCPTVGSPAPGGWNRIHLIVADIAAEVERLRAAGLTFRNDIVTGPGGQQILLDDPSGNPIELFQPPRSARR